MAELVLVSIDAVTSTSITDIAALAILIVQCLKTAAKTTTKNAAARMHQSQSLIQPCTNAFRQ